MKHLSLFILSFFLIFFSCNDQEDLVSKKVEKTETSNSSRLKFGEKVKFIDSNQGSYSTIDGWVTIRKYKVEVANIGTNKKVYAHYQSYDGLWKDVELIYGYTTSYGTEIWEVSNQFGFWTTKTPSNYGKEFVIKYVVNGQTYWDNNNYKNYIENGTLLLGNDVNISLYNVTFTPQSSSNSNLFLPSVVLKNLAYAKEVKMVFTTDSWKTTQVIGLKYNYSDYGNNTHEVWSTFVNLPTNISKVEYAFSYKVNGVEYWDNNFGRNYTTTLSN